jgi:hypothetical protein
MGPERSIRKAGKRLTKNAVSLGRLSKKYHWVERARAYDAYINQEKLKSMEKEIVEAERRHAEHAQHYQEVALSFLSSLDNKLRHLSNTNSDIGALLRFAAQYPRVYKEIVEIEREARGLEKDKTIYLLRPDHTQTAKHDPGVQQRSVESSIAKTGNETGKAQENPLPEGVAAKIEEVHNEQQGGGRRKIKTRRIPL